ncbi:MAG: threonine--tRNA ligase [Candidatus Nomurabacteria bacterium]|jgi:threonyl-tRNA synthetase|nr:threonine--tRNA ligase [Candidatus Nomurabacteria bacterium]
MENDKLYAIRHSLAHIMASAIQRIYGADKIKFGVGPVVENGFYYDIDMGDEKISPENFTKIEKEMRKIIAENQDFVRSEKTIDEAIEWAKSANQPYKVELLNDLKREGITVAKDLNADELGTITDGDAKVEKVSFYTNGDFTDLCRGPHVANTSEIPADAFKLARVAGAYWRGDEKNPMMTRIYGLAFASKQELEDFLAMQEEAKKRDHRKLGKELDLFCMSPLIGAGLPMFTPRGMIVRDAINDLVQGYRLRANYQKVWTPNIALLETYKTSGHFEKFPELMRFNSSESGDELALKPVSCPHHAQIYVSQPRSYRELPVKYLETATVYRDERKGELGGLSRVRAITQDDSHVFCTDEQVGDVFAELIESARELYKLLNMDLSLRLSFRDDGDGYIGDEKLWEKAQNSIREMADKFGMKYEIGMGEAAMYGPKMDFMARDAMGREWQLATVQLDYAQPERFALTYTDENGQEKRPVMVHCALVGSLERFMSIYIEHTAGKFPVWCAPEQLRVIKVKDDSEAVNALCDKIKTLANEHGVRVAIDDSNNSVGKKIRSAEMMKVPYSVVVGDKEAENGLLPLRIRNDLLADDTSDRAYKPEQLIQSIANEARGRVSKSSL